ncbi:exodeoxyribonuclease V subunit gamma, partial [Jatrophihabitans endophyticus]|uniref:exodeoxyribonuclease V subunit gamma n=1 Tax=Jatrophihabitans endophyticus TaxID=1206085 RepID=UPI0019E61717
MLSIHRAERADALVAGLAALLARSVGDPMRPEVVAVPSRGVERWLAQQLSHVLGAGAAGDGVCANVEFPSSSALLDELLAEADPEYAAAVEAWQPERVHWPLLDLVDRTAPVEPWLAVLAAHLGLGADRGAAGDRGRRLSVVRKLALLFDRYGRARPDLIAGWRQGVDGVPDDLVWQPRLWRLLRDELGVPAPAELLDQACAAVGAGPAFSVFG